MGKIKSSFIRIEGFSGIGKTRFVYESLNDNKFKICTYVKEVLNYSIYVIYSFLYKNKHKIVKS